MNGTRVVILAGGQGARFWPLSRMHRPKQFLSISPNGESLIQATARRVVPLCGEGKPLIVTNVLHEKLIREHVPDAEVVCEPIGRNTAASIGLAAMHLKRQDPQAVMIVLPADHAVKDESRLRDVLSQAVKVAREEPMLVTIGVQPSFPHTGYGYIKRGEKLGENVFKVARFFEKPNEERAKKYFESGEFFWNSGMFVWRVEVFLQAMAEYMPELTRTLGEIEPALGTADESRELARVFPSLESISIDFGVLEHARNCAVITANGFGWNDVGSWDAWAEHFEHDSEGNLVSGSAVVMESQNCVVKAGEKMVAVLGAHDLIIIDAGDAMLICPRERVQEVRKVVDELKAKGRGDLI